MAEHGHPTRALRVLVASTGGAGHFTPMIPFVDACRRAGHEVLVVGPPGLAESAAAAGYAFRGGGAPPDEELGPVWARVPTVAPDEAERIVIGEIFATLNVRAMLPAMREAVERWRPDVVLHEPGEMASAIVAEEASVPHVRIGTSLIGATSDFAVLAAPALEAWRPGVDAAIAASPYLTLFPGSIDPDDRAGASGADVDGAVLGGPALGTSALAASALVARFRDPSLGARPDPLPPWWPGDDRPLLYVSFGSVAAQVPAAAPIYDVALDAVADLPARVLLTTGHGGLPTPRATPPNVCVREWVPQADVLPHADAVLCHGGSGTTLGALAAGVPLVITPLFADQPHNARSVAAAGAGIAVLPRRCTGAPLGEVAEEDLRSALASVLADPGYGRAARAIAQEIGQLPPADDAVPLLSPE